MFARDWTSVGSTYFQNVQLYEMKWDNVDISKSIISMSPFGGPIAVTNDLLLDNSADPNIYIFTASGGYLSTIIPGLSIRGVILRMGWTNEENLVIVTSSGMVYIYTVVGFLLKVIEFPEEVVSQGLLEIKVWESGVLFFTKRGEFWVVNDLFNDVINKYPINTTPSKLLSQFSEEDLPNWIEVYPLVNSKKIEIFICPQATASIFILTASECQEISLEKKAGPFARLSISPNGLYLATFSKEGLVWIISTDFHENILEFDSKVSSISPSKFCWCGSDAVCCYWTAEQLEKRHSVLLLIYLDGSYQKFTFPNEISLQSEIDGVRIVSAETSHFLHKLPGSLVNVFGIGSLEPSALLYDAYLDYQERKYTSFQNTRAMKEKMKEAIDTCLDAALCSFDITAQKVLLNTIAFGKIYCPDFDNHKFVQGCTAMRIMNSVRDPSIGMAITYHQYRILSPIVVIDRLINRNQYTIAVSICEHIHVDIKKALLHWATGKLQAGTENDQKIVDIIQNKFKVSTDKIPFAQLALVALKLQKKELASRLLSHEKNSQEQVMLYVRMGEWKDALGKAINSNDYDLVYFVLIALYDSQKIPLLLEFLAMPQFRLARDYMIAFAKDMKDDELLNQIYKAMSNYHCIGRIHFEYSLKMRDFSYMDQRVKYLEEAKKDFEFRKISPYDASICKDNLLLLDQQMKLDQQLQKVEYTGLSVIETIGKLIASKNKDMALQMKKIFGIGDKQFWFTMIRSLAFSNLWEELEALGNQKSPIGYTPFVEVCVTYDNQRLARQFIDKLKDPAEKVEYLLRMGRVDEAFGCCTKEFSSIPTELILRIRAHSSSDNQLKSAIDKFLLSKKRS